MAAEKKTVEKVKAKVLKRFKDKYTGKVHKEGDIITVKKDRFAEILKVGPLVEEYKEEKKAEKVENTAK